VGVIRLAAFNSRAVPDVAAAVRRLAAAGAAEFVLDLRDTAAAWCRRVWSWRACSWTVRPSVGLWRACSWTVRCV